MTNRKTLLESAMTEEKNVKTVIATTLSKDAEKFILEFAEMIKCKNNG